MEKITVSLDEIENKTVQALIKHGAETWIAAEVGKAVRLAEATKNIICGLYYLESYCLQLVSGRVDGKAVPRIYEPKPGSVLVDAKFGFAQAAFSLGLAKSIEKVRNNGIALLGIAHAHTCTSLGYFTKQIAENGFIGIGFANASAIVAAPGGKNPILGTNPIAMSVPKERVACCFNLINQQVQLHWVKSQKQRQLEKLYPWVGQSIQWVYQQQITLLLYRVR